MTAFLEQVLDGPGGERWLTAHNDPLAGIYTFSSCIALSGKYNKVRESKSVTE